MVKNMKKMSAYKKDIWCSIWKGKKRFFAIMVITFLGTMMFSGLKAACMDLRHSADRFFDKQKLFDLCIMSTLGLTEDDLEVIRELEEVEHAEGVYSETVRALANGNDLSVVLKTYYPDGINQPYVVEGHLPKEANETVITEKFAKAAGLWVGDTLTISENLEEEEEANFAITEYRVSGIIVDALDVNNSTGAVSFRASATDEDTLYILPEAVKSEVYTAIYLILDGSSEMFCYSEEYEAKIDAFTEYIEAEIKEQRAKDRTEEVKEEAYKELEEAEQEVYEELDKAEQELLDGEKELEEQLKDAKEQLLEGETEFQNQIADAKEELLQGEKDIEDGLLRLEEAEQTLREKEREAKEAFKTARKQLADGYAQLEEGQVQVELLAATVELTESTLQYSKEALKGIEALERESIREENATLETKLLENRERQSELQRQIEQAQAAEKVMLQLELETYKAAETLIIERQNMLETQENELETKYESAWAELAQQEKEAAESRAQLDAAQAEIDNGRARLDAGLIELEAQEEQAAKQFSEGRAQIAEGRKALESGRKDLIDGWAQYEQGKTEGEQQIAEGWEEYEKGKAEGEEKLEAGRLEFEGGKAEAEEEIEKARRELADMDVAEWYIQNRNSLSGYSNIKSDADSIESIGTVFPIVFFVVAVLISLTTITRMVEEDRGLIGTYKALGFYDREIRRKYMLYAFCASMAGSIIGTIGAFIMLPGIIFVIFDVMYLLPDYVFLFDAVYGLSGPVLFVGGIITATTIACRNELVQTPVALMRPKTPRSGSRVLLERLPFVWNRMSFLNKVTARNLFRYKKRLLMTISGIMGCMALLLFGFAIKDSVTDLVPRQYEQTFFYDAMVVAGSYDNDRLLGYLNQDDSVAEYLNTIISSVKVENSSGRTESVQLIVTPDAEELRKYVELRNLKGQEVVLQDGEVFLTQNASLLLDLEAGDKASLQTIELDQAETTISGVVQNYLGNYVYMTQATYEGLFGDYEPNGALVFFSEECKDPVLYCTALGNQEGIISCISSEEMKGQFDSAFMLINMVVYIVIIMAATLAFAVLFTLATTNISERTRELATIKVLGFYDQEVHSYVNKETMILTGIGILLGIPLGYAFAQTLTIILTMPSMYLAVSLHPVSYLIAGGLSLGFALLVNKITDKSLDDINPVEALKSVE